MLTTGIVGLPNVGKSTLFNALTRGHANVSNYPFTTIDSNMGMAQVPDRRLEDLARTLSPAEVTPCSIEYFDIAGLVEGASHGEGLGNQFLGSIRAVDAIVHVLRCFGDSDVSHVAGEPDPLRDAGLVETELLVADLEVLEGAIEKRRRTWKADPKRFVKEEERLAAYRETLEQGVPLRSLDIDSQARQELKSLGLLSSKPVLYVANVGEDEVGEELPAWSAELGAPGGPAGVRPGAQVIPISAKIEAELLQLNEGERLEFMEVLGLESAGRERLIEATFSLLGLIRFYTLANNKLRAWELERGSTAPRAAGKVHTEMEEGFIRARVATCEDVLRHGSLHELHHLGKLRIEGKDYEVQDGDVIEFLFNK